MKSKFAVIGIASLMCFIPVAIFFVFRDQGDGFGVYTKQTLSTSWPLEKSDDNFKVTLDTVNAPLKRGKQTLNLQIESMQKGEKLKGEPTVKILMPMGKDTMEIPITLKKLTKPNQYQIQGEFTMAGDWEADITPSTSPSPIQLNFNVEM